MSKHCSSRIWPFVVLGVTSACAHVGESPAAAQSAEEARRPPIREHESASGIVGGAMQGQGKSKDLMSALAADLSQRIGVGVENIEVVSVDPMTWNDSSLGCPQPGQSYLPAQTPGVRVVMKNNGQAYEYHAANSGSFVLCANATRTADGLDRE
jgi:hypothetical protein